MRRFVLKTHYKNHINANLNDIIRDFKMNDTSESNKMYAELKPIIKKLQNNGTYQLQNISMIFKDCGISCKNINQIIFFLLDKLQDSIKVGKREINKLTDSYRNIIFNWLFLDFSKNIIQLVDEYVTNKCPFIHNHDFLLLQLKTQINIQKSDNKIEITDEIQSPDQIETIKEDDLSHYLSLINYNRENEDDIDMSDDHYSIINNYY